MECLVVGQEYIWLGLFVIVKVKPIETVSLMSDYQRRLCEKTGDG